MTKIEVVKTLLRMNLRELNEDTFMNGLTIEFKDDEFIVRDKNKKIVLKDKILKYDVDFESQKKFVLDVAKNVVVWVKPEESVKDFYENMLDDYYYIDVLGEDYVIYKTAQFVEVDIDKKVKIDKEKNPDEYWDKYLSIRDYYIEEIRKNLDENKIRMVFYYDNIKDRVGFYVDEIIHKYGVYVYYMEDTVDLDELDCVSDLVSGDKYYLLYSITTKKDLEDAVKFIEKLTA